MAGKAPLAFLVEARQLTGEWEPVAAPRDRPFTREAAEKRLEELLKEKPFLQNRRAWLRVMTYEQAPVRWKEPEDEIDDEE